MKKKKYGVEMDSREDRMPSMPKRSAVERAGHEMKVNPPAQLEKTARKFGRKRMKKQRVAIMLAKARKGE